MGIDAVRNVKVNFIAEDKNVGSTASGIKSSFAAVAIVAGTAAAAVKLFNRETTRLDETAKAFDKSGIATIEVFQQLQQVAKLGGSDIDKVSKATVRLDRNLFAISQKSGKAANDALIALGLTAEDLADADAPERLGILADALLEVENTGRRAALAEELLGRSGRDLLPVLKQGSEGIDEMVASVDNLWTREDLAAAEAYEDALTELEKSANDAKTELVVGLAPAFTEITNEIREGGETASAVMPTIVAILKNTAEGLKQPLQVIGFFAEQLAVLGRVGDFVAVRFEAVTDAASDAAAEVRDFAADTALGEWAQDAAAGLGDMGLGLDGITDDLREQSPIIDDLALSWDELGRAISGAEAARAEFTAIGSAKKALGDLIGFGKQFNKQQEDAAELGQERVDTLVEEAKTAEFISARTRAEGGDLEHINVTMLEGLRLRSQAADLQASLTQDVKDEAKALDAKRKLAIAEAEVAAASASSRGGGRRITAAQRLLAAGEQRVAQLELQAKIAGTLAEDGEDAAEAERASFAAARARLDLDLAALEVTKARGDFAQQELANRVAANAAAAEALDADQRAAEQERVNTLVGEAISIETARSAVEANAAARRFEQLGMEFEARELLRQQRELELQANPPEDEIARLEQADALAQLSFDREMDRSRQLEEEGKRIAARQEAEHAAELKRIQERVRKQKAAVAATSKFLSLGQQFASTVIGAAIKDEDKRAKAELKARGIMAIATGALEVVRAAASFASQNYLEGAMHTAAAALAFTTGGVMIAGGVPGQGSASVGGGAAAAAPAADRDTAEAARTVESLPSADGEPVRQPRAGQDGGGGNTIIFEAGSIQGLDPTDETIETIRLGLDNVNDGLEAAS